MPRVVIEGMSAEEVAELVRRLGGDVAITVTESTVKKAPAKTAGKAGRPRANPIGGNLVFRSVGLEKPTWDYLTHRAKQEGMTANELIRRLLAREISTHPLT